MNWRCCYIYIHDNNLYGEKEKKKTLELKIKDVIYILRELHNFKN